jgi:nucleoid DNA-binding protein
MNPQKSSKLYKVVSEDLNISQALVENIIEYYYKEVRICMSELNHVRLNVTGLGHFFAKSQKVKKDIVSITAILKTHDVSTFKAYFSKKNHEETLDKLIILDKELTEQKELRIKHKDESSLKSNLGE